MTNSIPPDSPATDDDVRQLMLLATPRLTPPEESEARVREAVLAAFDSLPAQSPAPARWLSATRRWPATGHLALAATVLAACAVTFLLLVNPPQDAAGEILFASGGYTLRGERGDNTTSVMPGSIIQTTGAARLQIALHGGATLRLDQHTSATVHSNEEVWLHSGRIYVDSQRSSINIVTPYASVTDVGTQFEVAVADSTLTVAVREGQVDVGLGDEIIRSRADAGMGELLTIEALTLQSRQPVRSIDPHWAWVQQARPRFNLHGRSVADYLRWAARESGRKLTFESQLVRQQAAMPAFLGDEVEVDADSASVELALRTTSFAVDASTPDELLVRFKPM